MVTFVYKIKRRKDTLKVVLEYVLQEDIEGGGGGGEGMLSKVAMFVSGEIHVYPE